MTSISDLRVNIFYQHLFDGLLDLVNVFHFPELEPPVISILYGCQGCKGQLELCSVWFFDFL